MTPPAAPLRVVADGGEVDRERDPGDQGAQLGGEYRPEDRRGDAVEKERCAPDRREQDETGGICAFQRFFSRARSFLLRTMPQAYPPRPPSVRTARWQGTASATGFAPQALPTARTAAGAPMARAMSR